MIIVAGLFFGGSCSYAQPALPTRSLEVKATQELNFGTFALTGSGGGSVVVGYDGSRSKEGSIALLGNDSQPAIFEVKLLQGRNVYIQFTDTATLLGSDGGSLTLNIGPTEQGGSGASFSTQNSRDFTTPLRVGGKLDIPGTAMPGTYSGYFYITFNQE